MKSTTVIGVVLVVLGILALVYQGIIGPIQTTTKTDKTIPLPPLVGGLALVGGIVLIVAGNKK